MSKINKKKKLRIAEMEKPNNAVVYIRVSTDEQAKKGYSLDGQENECKKFATLEGLNVVEVFREEGESAKSTNRHQFKKMMEYCKKNKKNIKAVIFWKFERFMRMLRDQNNTLYDLSELGIEVMSVTEPNDKGAAGNLTRNLLGALAQYDNELKSERVLNGMKTAFKSGRWLWRAPFGYVYDKVLKHNIVPKEPECNVVKYIFNKFVTGCYSQADILEDLKKDNIKMRPALLCSILRNSLYCGLMQKYEWSDTPVKGTFEPLITEKVFNTVQDILNGRKPVIAPHDFNNPDYPLKQFLVCPYCGKPLTGSTSTGRNHKKFYYYACYNPHCSNKFSMSKDKVEHGFQKILEQITPKEELLGLFKTIVCDVYNNLTAEESALNKKLQLELEKLTESKKRLVSFYLDGKLDEDMYNLKLNDFVERENEIKTNQLNNLLPKEDFESCLSSSVFVIQNLAKAWNDSTLKIKKSLQKLIFPNGLNADFETFQNTEIASIFNKIGALSAPNSNMVPPGEFESPSPP